MEMWWSDEWYEVESQHRTVRKNLFLNQGATLKEGNNVHLDKYLEFQKDFLEDFILFYNSSFSDDYRRLSKKLEINIVSGFDLNAKVKNTETNFVMDLSLGTVTVLEDAYHSIFADPHTDLARNFEDDPRVYKIDSFQIFDYYRYYDYEAILNLLKKRNLSQSIKTYINILFKFISASRFRQTLADIATDIGLYWLLAHEDAHKYLGHLLYFKETLGSNETKDEYFFLELISSLQKYDTEERKASELEADTNATIATIDYFLDGKIFDVYPVLKNSFIAKYESAYSFLVRLITLSIITVIVCFERNLIKNRVDQKYYPTFSERTINILINILPRSAYYAYKYQQSYLHSTPVLIKEILQKDLYSITSSILDNNHIIVDNSMEDYLMYSPFRLLQNKKFADELLMYFAVLGNDVLGFPRKDNPFNQLIVKSILANIKCHDIILDKFKKFRFMENPSMPGKIHESIMHHLNNRRILRDLLR